MTVGLRDRVAVVGMGCTKFGEHWDKSTEDLMVEAAWEAFEDAGLGPEDMQAAWLSTTQSGRGGSTLAHAIKLEYIPVTRLENHCATGLDAMRNAAFAIAAGCYDIALVVGVEKLKDQGFSGLQGWPEIALSEAKPVLPAPLQFALSGTRYFHHYGLKFNEGKEILAKIAVKNHKNGALNPRAHLRREITVEQAVKAPMVTWPLGLFDCCGVSDGAAAAILASPDVARKLRPDAVSIKGFGLTCGAFQGQIQNSFDYVHFEETVRAAHMAYQEAGVTDPRKQISIAEVHDCFTITELMTYEDLGFSPRGRARDDVEAGTFALDGALPVNPDGGLKSFGHPIGASGIRMCYELYKQLQGKAGPRQVKNVELGLAHNLGGRPSRFTCGICILGR